MKICKRKKLCKFEKEYKKNNSGAKCSLKHKFWSEKKSHKKWLKKKKIWLKKNLESKIKCSSILLFLGIQTLKQLEFYKNR